MCVSDWGLYRRQQPESFGDLHHDLTSCVDSQHPAAGDDSHLLCTLESQYRSGNTLLSTTTSHYHSTSLLPDLSSNPAIKTLERHTRRPQAVSLLWLTLNPKCSNLCLETDPFLCPCDNSKKNNTNNMTSFWLITSLAEHRACKQRLTRKS